MSGVEKDGDSSAGAAIAAAEITVEAETPVSQGHPFDVALNTLLSDLHAIFTSFRIALPHVLKWLQKEHEENAKTLDKFQAEHLDNGEAFFKVSNAHQEAELLATLRAADKLRDGRIPDTLQRSLFILIFSEFDAFIGTLLKAIYTKKEHLLKGITRELSFADLLEYEDLASIKNDMLDREIDSFRRESYVDQFAKLEAKFGLKTLKSFREWPEFVELSQRRNLLVHNAGCVNSQYLAVCDREGYKFEDRPAIGCQLLPSVEYFVSAIVLVSKVGLMLTHTLWRKLCSDEIQIAHAALNNTIFEVLKDKRWNTAREMCEFGLTDHIVKDINDIDLRIRTVNAAIASKFSEHEARAKQHIASIDWTASNRDFKLAIAVLEDRHQDAAEIMRLIGRNGELVSELAYHEWPLFFKFRETPAFLGAYKDIFGTSFVREAVRQSADEAKKQANALRTTADSLDVKQKQIDASTTPIKSE